MENEVLKEIATAKGKSVAQVRTFNYTPSSSMHASS